MDIKKNLLELTIIFIFSMIIGVSPLVSQGRPVWENILHDRGGCAHMQGLHGQNHKIYGVRPVNNIDLNVVDYYQNPALYDRYPFMIQRLLLQILNMTSFPPKIGDILTKGTSEEEEKELEEEGSGDYDYYNYNDLTTQNYTELQSINGTNGINGTTTVISVNASTTVININKTETMVGTMVTTAAGKL